MKPKFRAWDKPTKTMVDVLSIDFLNKKIIGEHPFFGETIPTDFDEVVIMQSTDLVDENGKEIYEGDIVKTTRIENSVCEANIVYEYDKDYTGVVKMLEGAWVVDTGSKAVYLWSEIEENEVIGNIYENPELLEEK